MKFVLLGVVLASSCGCSDTGQQRTRVPLYVAGTDITDGVVATGDVAVTVDSAQLAFGPLYLCGGYQAGELCETARLEWLDSVVVNAMDGTPMAAGELVGVTGPVRSFMFDLGLTSVFTSAQPLMLPAAREIGGVSVRVLGSAEVDGVTVPFVAAIQIQQEDDTELGVPVIRKSANEVFTHDVKPNEPPVLVRFDARRWLRDIDFRQYVERASCTPGGPDVVCEGVSELTCAADGSEAARRDCGESAQVCVRGEGCRDQVTIRPGTQGFRALRNAIVASQRPAFEWGFSQQLGSINGG
jgi:hypothetical protein